MSAKDGGETMKGKGFQWIIPLLFMLISLGWIIAGIKVYGFYSSSGPESGFYPTVCAVLLFIVSLTALPSACKEEKIKIQWNQFLPVAGISLVVLSSNFVGIYPAILAFLFLWLWGYEKYPWKFSLLVSVGVALFIWGVFDCWMNIHFPSGLLFKAILG